MELGRSWVKPEWVPCVVCGGDRPYLVGRPDPPKPRKRLFGVLPAKCDERCPHCRAQ
jgi:hypothetical protein